MPVEIISPSRIFSRLQELRDPRILKILSTTAIYAAPFARRSICMAYGVPCAFPGLVENDGDHFFA